MSDYPPLTPEQRDTILAAFAGFGGRPLVSIDPPPQLPEPDPLDPYMDEDDPTLHALKEVIRVR